MMLGISSTMMFGFPINPPGLDLNRNITDLHRNLMDTETLNLKVIRKKNPYAVPCRVDRNARTVKNTDEHARIVESVEDGGVLRDYAQSQENLPREDNLRGARMMSTITMLRHTTCLLSIITILRSPLRREGQWAIGRFLQEYRGV